MKIQPEFETMNPKREVLIAWLEEASRKGTVTPKAMRRLCFEAALMLRRRADQYFPPSRPAMDEDDVD